MNIVHVRNCIQIYINSLISTKSKSFVWFFKFKFKIFENQKTPG